jgi:hypothetical protein
MTARQIEAMREWDVDTLRARMRVLKAIEPDSPALAVACFEVMQNLRQRLQALETKH